VTVREDGPDLPFVASDDGCSAVAGMKDEPPQRGPAKELGEAQPVDSSTAAVSSPARSIRIPR
jgi:hypothetical protein